MKREKIWYILLGIFIYFIIDQTKTKILQFDKNLVIVNLSKSQWQRNRAETTQTIVLRSENRSDSKSKPGLEDVADVVGLEEVNYCQHLEETDFLVVIPSGAPYLERRMYIRYTWAKSKVFSKTLFFVARTDSASLELKILEESRQFKDILRINTPDSYGGVTFRIISMFKWLNNNCHKGFIIKVDDDMLIHPGIFITSGLLDQLVKLKNEKVVFGGIRSDDIVPRSGKWAISEAEWPLSSWPNFTLGFCYVMTQPALAAIVQGFLRSDYYIWLEDVYMTGILLKSMGGYVKELNMFKNIKNGGGYVPYVYILQKLVQENRNETTGLVELKPLRDYMAKIAFYHVQDFSSHALGYEIVREFIWGTLWEMDSGTKHLTQTRVDFCISSCG